MGQLEASGGVTESSRAPSPPPPRPLCRRRRRRRSHIWLMAAAAACAGRESRRAHLITPRKNRNKRDGPLPGRSGGVEGRGGGVCEPGGAEHHRGARRRELQVDPCQPLKRGKFARVSPSPWRTPHGDERAGGRARYLSPEIKRSPSRPTTPLLTPHPQPQVLSSRPIAAARRAPPPSRRRLIGGRGHKG